LFYRRRGATLLIRIFVFNKGDLLWQSSTSTTTPVTVGSRFTSTTHADVGLYVEDFSAYSYRNGEHLYLEEDCDAGRFLAAWDKALRKFDVRHIDDGYNSPIRSYEHIIPLGRLADELNDEIPF
jgi:hypothetical protein